MQVKFEIIKPNITAAARFKINTSPPNTARFLRLKYFEAGRLKISNDSTTTQPIDKQRAELYVQLILGHSKKITYSQNQTCNAKGGYTFCTIAGSIQRIQ